MRESNAAGMDLTGFIYEHLRCFIYFKAIFICFCGIVCEICSYFSEISVEIKHFNHY